jgi:hypothetical protein
MAVKAASRWCAAVDSTVESVDLGQLHNALQGNEPAIVQRQQQEQPFKCLTQQD